jgi:hypothetical protein
MGGGARSVEMTTKGGGGGVSGREYHRIHWEGGLSGEGRVESPLGGKGNSVIGAQRTHWEGKAEDTLGG